MCKQQIQSKMNIDVNGDIRWIAIINELIVLHREGGPAVIEKADGTERWMINNKLHREDGPAIYRKVDGLARFFLDGLELIPEMFIYDTEFQQKHPKLVISMLIHLVHNS